MQYVSLDQLREKYRSTYSDDENSQYLVTDVVNALLTRNIDWGLFDWNGDGFVNQLIIIYPGKGMHDGGGNKSIWPHQWWMSCHLKDRTSVYCEPLTVSSNGQQYYVDCYCALQEISGNKVFGSFGTICHEYFHCFGFPDYYYGDIPYLGEWALMDNGNFNGGGFCPPALSAHERWLMGWLEPVELKEPTSVTGMKALSDAPQAYIIRNDAYGNEYYFVENRQKSGWDSSLPGSGILVFHIDFDEEIWSLSTDNVNSPYRKRYTVFPADNITQSSSCQNWAFPYKYNDILSDRSKPATTLIHSNSDNLNFMNKPLTEMTITDSLASFKFMEPAPKAYPVNRIWYTFNMYDMTAQVAMPENIEFNYTDTVVIPKTVVFKGQTFTVTGLGPKCFISSKITSLTLPQSVTHIDKHAFYGCDELKNITLLNPAPATVEFNPLYGLSGLNQDVSLQVPTDCMDAYYKAPYWELFGTIVTAVDQIIPEYSADSDTWYDLSGIRLTGYPTRSGIYIHNGKKVQIKRHQILQVF